MKNNLTKGRMDDFFILRMGKTPPRDNSDYWLNGTNNWVAISDMGKSKYISSTSECITDKGIADCNMVPVPANTVVMSFKLSIGKTAITSKPIFTNEAIMSFLPKTEFADNILVDYIYYYLLGHRWGGTGKKAVMGVTLNKASLSATPFSFPSLADQKQAIAELDKINETIEDCRELLRNLDALAQSLFYDTFGNPITNPKGWEVKKLSDECLDVVDGDHSAPPKTDKGVPFITISNIDKTRNSIDFSDTFFVPQSYYDGLKDNRKARNGDVLYTVTGSYGVTVLIENLPKFCFQRHIGLIRPKATLNSVFLSYWGRSASIKAYADTVATGIAQKTVSLKSLRDFPIILPPLSLQEQFAARIEQIEAQKKAVEQTIAELQTLLDSRMDYWFN